MKILMTGGTGLIGSHFIKRYSQYRYTVLTRSPDKARSLLPDDVALIDSLDTLANLNDFDAVINLAGEPIIGRRWGDQQKQRMCHSRWDLTEKIVELIKASEQSPKVFLSGSAVGIYGDGGTRTISESESIEVVDFPTKLCQKWENIARQGASETTRVALLRTGIVLSTQGGALEKMLPAFRLNVGGKLGDGEQFMAWVHIDDMVGAIDYLLKNDACTEAFNMCAPEPVSNAEFTSTLANALNRVAIFTVPKFALKLALGEASQLLLDSQRVVPQRLQEAGYEFKYPQLREALKDIV